MIGLGPIISQRRGRLRFVNKKKFFGPLGRAGFGAAGSDEQKFFAPLFFKKAAASCFQLNLSCPNLSVQGQAAPPCRKFAPAPSSEGRLDGGRNQAFSHRTPPPANKRSRNFRIRSAGSIANLVASPGSGFSSPIVLTAKSLQPTVSDASSAAAKSLRRRAPSAEAGGCAGLGCSMAWAAADRPRAQS